MICELAQCLIRRSGDAGMLSHGSCSQEVTPTKTGVLPLVKIHKPSVSEI